MKEYNNTIHINGNRLTNMYGHKIFSFPMIASYQNKNAELYTYLFHLIIK